MEDGIQHITISKWINGKSQTIEDKVAIEAPLEIQIQKSGEQPISVSVTMRTPGDDEELALGFLFTEAILADYQQVKAVSYLGENIVKVHVASDFQLNLATTERNFYTSSSCGVCGKASIEAIHTHTHFKLQEPKPIANDVLFSLKEKLAEQQSLFSETGGIHAAALFSYAGELQLLREDVGRHNALDKLIGASLRTAKLPLADSILLLSGRASFELVQKATMAGISTIVAVGAPSSLAVELAQENGQQLIGFLKEMSYNKYA
ncbi:MAG: hypothetical protein RLZZ337_1344 [Bacteroidota bacterium]|jgi:FdhD protein